MDEVTIGQILDVAERLTVVGLLLIIMVGGFKRWWVWGWMYDEARADGAEWKGIAMTGASVAEQAVDVAASRTASRSIQRPRT